ncbi:hypothetical protein M7I_1468 [Glarea lozoyensis 74030]|uniref:Uncharacterized protein n=1 Tax=Glarea lozoyensis (strain ATCC 74030 / MF5533) TaxID=1104152 RepID=H0EG60_GLAL7|nr:hypothetical protein M7I_1468 [Glarea lozoyensis 74030]
MAPSRSHPVKSGSGSHFELSAKKSLSSLITSTSTNYHTLTTSSSASDLNAGFLLPTALEPQPFERPLSSGSLPATPRFRRNRKNMKDFTGFDTTEDEFEALPLAVRRKVDTVKLGRAPIASKGETLAVPNVSFRRRTSLRWNV